jgi:DNA-binding PadR family transcriptional regulator
LTAARDGIISRRNVSYRDVTTPETLAVTPRRTEPADAADALSPQVFHILLSLADEPRHGYGILLEVEERTEGGMRLGVGTLYSVIKRLRQQELIEEVAAPRKSGDDPRRRHYRLTRAGRAAMRREAARLQELVEQARQKSVLPGAAR